MPDVKPHERTSRDRPREAQVESTSSFEGGSWGCGSGRATGRAALVELQRGSQTLVATSREGYARA